MVLGPNGQLTTRGAVLTVVQWRHVPVPLLHLAMAVVSVWATWKGWLTVLWMATGAAGTCLECARMASRPLSGTVTDPRPSMVVPHAKGIAF